MVGGSNRGGGHIFRTLPDRTWDTPSLLYGGYRAFPGSKAAGAGVDHPPHLALKLKKEWSSIYLLPLWIFVACYMVNIIGILIKVVVFHILNLKFLKPTFGLMVKGL
jgi:hypothetical protein